MAKARKMEVATMEVRPSNKSVKTLIPKDAQSLAKLVSILKVRQLKHNEIVKILAGINRGITPNQVTKLAKSIQMMGVVRAVIVARISFISGKSELYIVDGQHLYNACLRLNLPIPIVEIEIKDKQDLVEKIAFLNASSKTWSMFDYVTAWASLKEDYVKLNKYFEIYDFDFPTIAGVLSEIDPKSINKRLKSGEFKILNETRNLEILNHLTDALNIVPRMNRFENAHFCGEFINYLRTEGCRYNHKKTMEYLRKNKEKFVLATQESGKIQEMLKNIR